MTDIIIPVWNEPKHTKKCLKSVAKNTSDFRFVLIDNWSEKETTDILKKYEKLVPGSVLIRNKENLWFVKAINQGLKESKNDIVLLNNDTVVPVWWLDRMKEHMVAWWYDMIWPLSTAEPQRQYYKKVNIESWHMKSKFPMLAFFCVLIKKEIIKDVWLLDENIEVGLWDDDDYCFRAVTKGYRLWICDVLVEHNHRTSISKIKNIKQIQNKNMRYVRKKHNAPPRVLIAIPNTWNIHVNLVERLMSLDPCGVEFDIMFSCARPCSHNRNTIINKFMELDHDYLLQIDSDIVPPRNILEICKNDVDIVAAETHAGNLDSVVNLAFMEEDGRYKPIDTKEEKLYEVDAVWSGCICIKREVFEWMKKPYFFRKRKDWIVEVWHDLRLCTRAKKQWFKVFLDSSFKCLHFQTTLF